MVDFSKEEFEEILNIFLDESEEITKKISSTLIQLEKNPNNIELINVLFRHAHSLKGASRMVGFNNIQNLAHRLEDILDLAKLKKLKIDKYSIDILIETVDYINELIYISVKEKKESGLENYRVYVSKLDELLSENKNNQSDELVNKNKSIDTDIYNNEKNETIKEIPNDNWHLIFNLISESNKMIAELFADLNSYKIYEISDFFNKVFDQFELYKFEYEKNKIKNIINKLNFIENASNFLTNDDIKFMENEIEKIEKNIRKTAIKFGVNIISEYEEDFEEPILDFEYYLSEIIKKIKNLNSDKNEINAIKDDIQSIFQMEISNEKKNVFIKINSIMNYILQNEIKVNDQLREILSEIISSMLADSQNFEDYELILNRLLILQQMIELEESKENGKNPITKYQRLDDFMISEDYNEIKTLRVDMHKLDKLVNQVGELITNKIKTKNHIKSLIGIQDGVEYWHIFVHKTLNYIKYYERKSGSCDKYDIESMGMFVKQLFNVFKENSEKIHNLMEEISNLIKNIQDHDTKMMHTIKELELMVKSIRVLPMSVVFKALPRMVRDISKQNGKEIELFIMGSDVTADKKIIEEIKSPLIHIVRNAIDHGIEMPEEREAQLKPRVGKIYISAKHIENNIIIEIQDDGQGVSIKKVKEKALKLGYLTQDDINVMTDEQIMNIIFVPGFSTEDNITDISGRGIGLDVVQTKINSLNGKVDITSELTKGSKVTIELPTTMATIKVLVFMLNNDFYAIPMSQISHVRFVKNSSIIYKNKYRSLIIQNENIPVFDLKNILEINNSDNYINDDEKRNVIVVETDKIKMAYIVDRIVGDQEVLHTKLEPPIMNLNNVSGITNLATGELCLILNISGLIKSSYNFGEKVGTTFEKIIDSNINNKQKEKRILLVDDSYTSLKSLENMLINRFNVKLSNSVDSAINLIKNGNNFDIIVTDIEMPEKTGADLIKYLKSDKNYAKIPIIVLSSIKSETSIKEIMKMGIQEFIVKDNFDRYGFINKLDKLLEDTNGSKV